MRATSIIMAHLRYLIVAAIIVAVSFSAADWYADNQLSLLKQSGGLVMAKDIVSIERSRIGIPAGTIFLCIVCWAVYAGEVDKKKRES